MEHGDWCALRWVDSECVLAVPGLLRFHSAAPVDGEQPSGAKRSKGGTSRKYPASCMEIYRSVCEAITGIVSVLYNYTGDVLLDGTLYKSIVYILFCELKQTIIDNTLKEM